MRSQIRSFAPAADRLCVEGLWAAAMPPTASAPRDLPSQPDHSLRATLLTATGLRCTSDVPGIYLA